MFISILKKLRRRKRCKEEYEVDGVDSATRGVDLEAIVIYDVSDVFVSFFKKRTRRLSFERRGG